MLFINSPFVSAGRHPRELAPAEPLVERGKSSNWLTRANLSGSFEGARANGRTAPTYPPNYVDRAAHQRVTNIVPISATCRIRRWAAPELAFRGLVDNPAA
jgi:hypothetical protein